jgi:hypothetical protein
VYDHWLHAVRRCGTGLVLAGSPVGTGDLLDADLARRPPIDPRPGLAWLVTPTAAPTLLQLAHPSPVAHPSAGVHPSVTVAPVAPTALGSASWETAGDARDCT